MESFREDASSLARRLYPDKQHKQKEIIDWLTDVSVRVGDCDILIVHSPGGWGGADISNLIDWESSVIDGVETTLTGMGAKWILVQHFRTRKNLWDEVLHLPEQTWYALTGKIYTAKVMAEELRFLSRYFANLKIILLGASMGAAFNNTVMKSLTKNCNIYSIEMGIVFFHLRRRLTSEQVLSIDSNGLIPDPVVHWDFIMAARAYFTAPYRWLKYRIAGTPQKFSYCINVPGHEYRWEFPVVGERIKAFLLNKLKLAAHGSSQFITFSQRSIE